MDGAGDNWLQVWRYAFPHARARPRATAARANATPRQFRTEGMYHLGSFNGQATNYRVYARAPICIPRMQRAFRYAFLVCGAACS